MSLGSSRPKQSEQPTLWCARATSDPSASTAFATAIATGSFASTRGRKSMPGIRWAGPWGWEHDGRTWLLRCREATHRNEQAHAVALLDAVLIVVDHHAFLTQPIGLVRGRTDR